MQALALLLLLASTVSFAVGQQNATTCFMTASGADCRQLSSPNLQTGFGFAFASQACQPTGGLGCINQTGCQTCAILPLIGQFAPYNSTTVTCPACVVESIARPGCSPIWLGASRLDPTQQVPPVQSNASGVGVQTINQLAGGGLSGVNFTLTWSNLTTPTTLAHIHRGFPGENGPIVFPIYSGNPNALDPGIQRLVLSSNSLSGTASGVWNISSADLDLLLAGGFYYNVHSQRYPDGEIRGQVVLLANGDCLSSTAV